MSLLLRNVLWSYSCWVCRVGKQIKCVLTLAQCIVVLLLLGVQGGYTDKTCPNSCAMYCGLTLVGCIGWGKQTKFVLTLVQCIVVLLSLGVQGGEADKMCPYSRAMYCGLTLVGCIGWGSRQNMSSLLCNVCLTLVGCIGWESRQNVSLLSCNVSGSGADGAGGLHIAVLPKVHQGGPASCNDGTSSAPYGRGTDHVTCINIHE